MLGLHSQCKKSPVTPLADERILTGVVYSNLVKLQGKELTEQYPADIALQRLLSAVDSTLVDLQMVSLVEMLSTLDAVERLFLFVDSLMDSAMGRLLLLLLLRLLLLLVDGALMAFQML